MRRSKFAAMIVWLDGNKALLAKITYVSLVISFVVGLPLWPVVQPALGLDSNVGISLLVGAFVAQVGVILSLLVSVYEKSNPQEMWFSSHQEALTAIREALLAASKEKPCRLTWLGISLQSAWLALEQVLQGIENSELNNVQITLFQTEPDFLRALTGDNDGLAEITDSQFTYMTQRCRAMHAGLLSTRSEVVIAQYSYMPNFHGLMIGDHTLFMSTVRWHGEGRRDLSVPREPFEKHSTQTQRGRYSIELFKSWCERAMLSAQDHARIVRFPSHSALSKVPEAPVAQQSATILSFDEL